jgi:hypothetical protein
MSTPIPDFHTSGHPPTQEKEQRVDMTAEYWRKVEDEAPVQQVTRSEDAAKQLIGLAGILQGLYLAIFAFSDLRNQINSFLPYFSALVWLLFLLPILLWLICVYSATRVLVPVSRKDNNIHNVRLEHAWERTKTAYERAAQDKQKWLHRCHLALIGSFGAVFIVIVAFILLPAAPGPSPIHIIIVTPTPVITPTP